MSPDNELVVFKLGEYDSAANRLSTSHFLFLNREGDIVRKVDYDHQLYLYDFTLDDEGRFYVLGIDEIPKISMLDNSGRLIDKLELADLHDLHSCAIKVNSEGTVYLAHKMGLQILSSLDETGKEYLARGNYSGAQMALDEEDNLVVMYKIKHGNKEKYRIEKWDTKDRNKLWEFSTTRELYNLYFNRKNQKLYVLDSGGIQVWNDEGRPGGYIFKLDQFNLNSKAMLYDDLYIESDSIFLSLYQAGKKTLLRYSLVAGYEELRKHQQGRRLQIGST